MARPTVTSIAPALGGALVAVGALGPAGASGALMLGAGVGAIGGLALARRQGGAGWVRGILQVILTVGAAWLLDLAWVHVLGPAYPAPPGRSAPWAVGGLAGLLAGVATRDLLRPWRASSAPSSASDASSSASA